MRSPLENQRLQNLDDMVNFGELSKKAIEPLSQENIEYDNIMAVP